METLPSSRPHPPLVLIVDDEPSLLEIMAFALLGQGFQVLEATNGREAVDIALRERPSLIVLDMNLPVLSGEEVAEALRQDGSPIPPILVVTASGSAADRAKQTGASGFLEKPFDIEEFIATVRGLAAV